MYEEACRETDVEPEAPEQLGAAALWVPAPDLDGLVKQGEEVTASDRRRVDTIGEDATGIADLILFGLKGMAAYADHAQIIGVERESVYAFFHEALDFLARPSISADEGLAMALKVGEVTIDVMGLLDTANTGAYGNPVPTRVRVTPVKGKAILVSGHDFPDLEAILKQTEKGINVYHGRCFRPTAIRSSKCPSSGGHTAAPGRISARSLSFQGHTRPPTAYSGRRNHTSTESSLQGWLRGQGCAH